MGYLLERAKKKMEELKKNPPVLQAENIINLSLAEFSRRNIAIEIYSEVLKCNVWLCSDENMKAQIERDDPDQMCYTARELWQIVKLNPTPESLQKINEAKEEFPKLTLKTAG